MSIRLSNRSRRLARWSAGLLLLLLGLFTIILFVATGRPVPADVVSVDQLGSKFDWNGVNLPVGQGRPIFASLSTSGRCFTTIAPPNGESGNWNRDSDDALVTVMDTATMKALGSFWDKIDHVAHSFEISLDRQYLITWPYDQNLPEQLHIRHLESGTVEIALIEAAWGAPLVNFSWSFIFAPTCRQVLIFSDSRAVLFDLFERRTLAACQLPDNSRIVNCFFDFQMSPKLLVSSENMEVWDLASNKMEKTLGRWELQNREMAWDDDPFWGGVPSGTLVPAVVYQDGNLLLIRSLEDGRLLQSFSRSATGWISPRVSRSHGHFLICAYSRRHPLVRLAEGRHKGLEDWLESRLPKQPRLALMDLRTGKTWFDFLGDERVTVSDDGTRLISFTADGRYEYDVPPRLQYFTPWAWAALGTWLGLATVWWKLRKRRPA
jgi:hypothetical protein